MSSSARSDVNQFIKNPKGSIWHRWEPHIHAPGTILNDQFTGENAWEDFLDRIEKSDPPIRVLGITDYYTIDVYEKILEERKRGRLSNIGLVFPNVELRFGIETSKGSPINAHLLISPDHPDHILETKRFLSNLTFTVGEDIFQCRKEELVKLGKAHDKSAKDELSALRVGANQFKVSFDQLKTQFKKNKWARANILLAISGNTQDGSAGLKEDASFAALRTELERTAHIIFSSNQKQREFWIGKGAATKKELQEKWGGLKPCLHGSDAHKNQAVGKPQLDRYSWIKGDLTFESLIQACIEPEERVHIGTLPPLEAISSRTIDQVLISNAKWIETPEIEINPGLIAIIGARGSGKTALADLIAAGGFALSSQLNAGSFLKRADDLITNEAVSITWANGEKTSNEIKHVNLEDLFDSPKVQYLSQQFVEDLCSAEGLTDKLMSEIERVIFQAHKIEDRMGTTEFRDLLQLRSTNSRNARTMNEESMSDISKELIVEYERKDNLPQLNKSLVERNSILEDDKKNRQKLVGKGQEEREKQHETVSRALDEVRTKLDSATKRHLALENLKNEVKNFKTNRIPATTKKLKQDHAATNLTEKQWENFEFIFKGDVDKLIELEITKAKSAIEKIKGVPKEFIQDVKASSYIEAKENLSDVSFSVLTQELERIQSLIGVDKENSKKYAELSDRIAKEETNIQKIRSDIDLSSKSDERIKTLLIERRNAYKEVFEAIVDEEKELNLMYAPLMENLKNQEGTVGKLTFHVKRHVDLDGWAERGETLLDLRKNGELKGKGALREAAKLMLLEAWEHGTATDVASAMDEFRNKFSNTFRDQSLVDKNNRPEYRTWLKDFASWLYDTSHITVNYGIQYDHLNIKQLSPGTRGIVLLMLYLAIDKEDDRPLIIDQPEENLDPKSIFDELVPTFRAAKRRRQIIIITHNANLVVNTDADQVIVASCGEHKANELPSIQYSSGGIENLETRKKVCEILEGGEIAFRERAKRLRLNLI